MVIGTSFSLARNERASVKHLALVIESSNSPALSAADTLPEPWSGPRDEHRVLGTEAEILCQLAISTLIQYIQSKKQAEECVMMAQIDSRDRDRGASNPVPGYKQRHESLGALQVALPAPLTAPFKLLTAPGRSRAGWHPENGPSRSRGGRICPLAGGCRQRSW